MLTRIAGGRVIDPAARRDAVGDLWIEDGRIVAPPAGRAAEATHDAAGAIVLAGGIDIHSHIAGSNVNTARLLLPELRRVGAGAAGSADAAGFDAAPVSHEIGRLYAQMGFSLVVEPAIAPCVALQAQLDLGAIPYIDRAILAVLGNEEFLFRMLREGAGGAAIADYAARMLAGSRALGIKCINPGAAAALRENVRAFGLDDVVPRWGVSARAIMQALQRAVADLGLAHPLHLHCSNLGMPGNVETALATIAAAEGLPLHLAHLQFYAYGTEGPRKFSSAAARLAEAVNREKNITVDVGQVMFGQTVTISCDILRQFNGRAGASPRTWSIGEDIGNGGGIVPFRYRRTSFINAVQFAAGLELFLLIEDPARVFFTTDHPNGAPFTSYPDLFALLMRRDLREQWLATLPAEAVAMTTLPAIAREYTWPEIATMTRAAPARLLGLSDRGHLGPGARADIVVYRPQDDLAATFRAPALVFKDGAVVARDGVAVTPAPFGRVLHVAPGHDRAIDARLRSFYEDAYGLPHSAFDVPDGLPGLAAFEGVPCRR
jgi:formylmethanofuran dehydrogenase subunit A